jgi:acyl-coenzyme A thioesterase PaaI-like protein
VTEAPRAKLIRGLRGDRPQPNVQQRRRGDLASHVRRLSAELMTTTAPAPAVEEASTLVQRAIELLRAQPHERPYDTFAESSLAGNARFFLDTSPLVGPLNPLAPPFTVAVEGDHVVAEGRFTAPYEGPPGYAHGGYVAAILDEVLGFAQSLTGNPGMTARLQVRYRSPTPLDRALRCVGLVERVSGRKISTRATLHAGDQLCAEAEGLFVSIDPARFEQMVVERDARSEG